MICLGFFFFMANFLFAISAAIDKDRKGFLISTIVTSLLAAALLHALLIEIKA